MKNNEDKSKMQNDEKRQKCEVWTRVMGYHRPVSSFNKGKKSEHLERCHFVESKCNSVVSIEN